MTEEEYYWEKAEFQDPIAHSKHVANYRNGIYDSIAFDEQYRKEAEKSKDFIEKKIKTLHQVENILKESGLDYELIPIAPDELYPYPVYVISFNEEVPTEDRTYNRFLKVNES